MGCDWKRTVMGWTGSHSKPVERSLSLLMLIYTDYPIRSDNASKLLKHQEGREELSTLISQKLLLSIINRSYKVHVYRISFINNML